MPRLTLIGGTSHAGKSTLARDLAARLGARCVSTDSLGRHPGRPWIQGGLPVKTHVAAYYRDLSLDEQLTDVLAHYRGTVWPEVEKLVGHESGPLVLEGSALLPSLVAGLDQADMSALWLREDDDELTARIKAESAYEGRGEEERLLIERFIARTLGFQTWLEEDLARMKLPWGDPSSLFG